MGAPNFQAFTRDYHRSSVIHEFHTALPFIVHSHDLLNALGCITLLGAHGASF